MGDFEWLGQFQLFESRILWERSWALKDGVLGLEKHFLFAIPGQMW